MQGYELAFIVDPDLSEEKREKQVEAIKQLVEGAKGQPGELEVWGKRDFSFPINKKTSGVYYLLYFQSEPQYLIEIERRIKLDGDVLRYLLVKQQKRKIKTAKRRPSWQKGPRTPQATPSTITE